MAGSGGPEFTAVAVTGPASAWAFSSTIDGNGPPGAVRLSGSAFAPVPFPGRRGEQVDAAGAAGPSDVWAFTSANRAIRWDGCRWVTVRRFPGRNVSGVAVVAANDVWVFGQRYSLGPSTHGTWHYNGRVWTRSWPARGLEAASVVSPDDIWAYGASWTASSNVIAHWNGSAWRRWSVAALLPPSSMYCGQALNGIYGVSAADAWAVGSAMCQDVAGPSVLLHFAAGGWHQVADLGAGDPLAVLPDGHGGLWIAIDGVQRLHGEILHYTGGTLTSASLPIRPGELFLFGAAAAPAGAAAFAVGRRTVQPGLATTAVVLTYPA